MPRRFPGTTIEVTCLKKDASRLLFDGIFATGGITLSQVCIMTDLEPYMVQNWIKRGFVSSPKKRVYSREQLARILIINMLRESLQIEKICGLMDEIHNYEKAESTNLDEVAGVFGEIMAEIFAYRQDEWEETLRRMGFFFGKFIYLMDAYEDVETDIKKGTYNPLKKKFDCPDFEEECRTILTMMMSECCKEFEKLPILENVEILRNIL